MCDQLRCLDSLNLRSFSSGKWMGCSQSSLDRSSGNQLASRPEVYIVYRCCKSFEPQLSCHQLDQSKKLFLRNNSLIHFSPLQAFVAGLVTKAYRNIFTLWLQETFVARNSKEQIVSFTGAFKPLRQYFRFDSQKNLSLTIHFRHPLCNTLTSGCRFARENTLSKLNSPTNNKQ